MLVGLFFLRYLAMDTREPPLPLPGVCKMLKTKGEKTMEK
jgi:hypothetical protein